jgi:WD40 repeat protein
MEDGTASLEIPAGTSVGGFEVVRLLGRGGMGEVYLARDLVLGRKVALKFLMPGRVPSGPLDRILVEARTTARLNHPHIVTLYSVGEHEGRPFVALEYVAGPTLRQRLVADRPALREALRIGRAIAEALGEAHAQGVLHRDLKPENVIVSVDGRLRVVDFGLAKVVAPDGGGRSLSVQRAGTPRYMAPEQWLMGAVTQATDVWALGIMLSELCAGLHPFAGETLEELGRNVTTGQRVPFPDPAALPAGLPELIDGCLEVLPERRPSAIDAAAALSRLLEPAAHRDDGECPFPGLRPFSEKQSAFFFGRDAEVAELLDRLGEQAVLPIVGPSGGGKSSFVQAGVIPRLRERGSWAIVMLRPGDQPFLNLARALFAGDAGISGGSRDTQPVTGLEAPTSSADLADELAASPGALAVLARRVAAARGLRVLLFVDQLEELFTVVTNEAIRARFLDALILAADDPAEPVRLCFTIRDDFFGHLGKARNVRQAIGRVMLVRSPGPDELREMLQRPLLAVGHRYDDPDLVGEMVAAVGDEPGSLPLLQFAARTLWDRRDVEQRLLLRSAYTKMGGVAGALAEHADGVLAGLDADEVRLTRELLLRMVTPEGTSRPMRRAALLHGLDARAGRVLDVFIEARLLRAGRASDVADTQIELAHDSLIESWQRLARWIDEGREELALLTEVTQAAELWERRGRREDEVWRGDALRECERAVTRLGARLPENAARFLDAGRRRERRLARRRRLLQAAGVLALTLIAAGALVVAASFARQRRAAEAERRVAELQRAEAQRGGAHLALATRDPLTARAELRVSLETRDSPRARAVWWALTHEPLLWQRPIGTPVFSIDFSPDGGRIAVSTPRGRVDLFDAETAEVRSLGGFNERPNGLDFSPSGRTLAVSLGSGELTLVDLLTDERKTFVAHPSGGPMRVVFLQNDHTLVTGNIRGELRLWDLRDEAPGRTLVSEGAWSFAVSPDGRHIVTPGNDAALRIFDVASGAMTSLGTGDPGKSSALAFAPGGALAIAGVDGVVRIHDGTAEVRALRAGKVLNLRFSPDGRRLAAATPRGIKVWDVGSWRLSHDLPATAAQLAITFAPDSRRLATSGVNHTVTVYDLDTPLPRAIQRHTGDVAAVTFSRDGRRIVSAGADRTLRVWDVRSGASVQELLGATSLPLWLRVSRDGSRVVAVDQGAIRQWDLATGAMLPPLERSVGGLALGPGDAWLVFGGGDGSVRTLDAAGGRELRSLRLHDAPIIRLEASEDEQHLFTVAHGDTTIHVWNAATGAAQGALRGRTPATNVLSLSRDGRLLTACGADSKVHLWTVATGEHRVAFEAGRRHYSCALSPDGTRLASSDNTGAVNVVDLATGTARSFGGHGAAAGFGKHVAPVLDVAFNHDGTLLATGSPKSDVRLWHAATGRPVWRTVALVGWRQEMFSHRGWTRLGPRQGTGWERSDHASGGEAAPAGGSAWGRAVAETGDRAAFSADQRTLCLATVDDRLESWDLAADRRRFTQPLPAPALRLTELVALGEGCLVLADARARRYDGAGRYTDAGESVSLIGEGGLILAGGTLRVDGDARTRRVDPGVVTALAPVAGGALVADVAGGIQRISFDHEPALRFRTTRALPITRLLATANGLVVAGSDEGDIDLFDLATGTWLITMGHLHGSVRHLALVERRLLAATDLGDAMAFDLSVFDLERCELLREVWANVPIVVESDAILVKAPPADHPCSSGK